MTVRIIAYLVAALGLFGAGWTANGWRLNSAIAVTAKLHAESVMVATQKALALQEQIDRARDAKAAAVSDVETAATMRLQKANHEINTLRDALRVGTVGLRVAATCPRATSTVPSATPDTGVGADTAPRLTSDAEQAYLALRDGIVTQRETLLTCQRLLALR